MSRREGKKNHRKEVLGEFPNPLNINEYKITMWWANYDVYMSIKAPSLY